MSLFDEVLARTVPTVEAALAPLLTSATLLRDLDGKVRLLLELPMDSNGQDVLPPDWSVVVDDLRRQLDLQLGFYWGGAIWRHGQRSNHVLQALQELIQRERIPWDVTSLAPSSTLRWYKLERSFSKSAWRRVGASLPWSLDEPDAPAIVTFYSFKGGVGRTTAAAAVALLLARAGRRVVALDLDVEAPGLGPLLLGGTAAPDDGLVDYLLEVQLLAKRPHDLLPYLSVQNDVGLIGEGQPIRVMTAGRLDAGFLEKMARLDFEGFVTARPNPLTELLRHVREVHAPDFILLDSRSGFHDLGGFSLNELSHLDVIFGLDTEQSWAGMEMVVPILAQSRVTREVMLVHSLVTPEKYDRDANLRFRERGFDLLQEHYYSESDEVPDIETGPYGLPLPYQDDLLNLRDLRSVLGRLVAPDGPYAKLAHAMGTYLERETL